MLLSATPTAIFAASLIARTAWRKVMVQVGLHGNLNEVAGWRSRNPLVRAFDLPSALASRHGGRVRFLVLEEAIRRQLARITPRAASVTDVLPLPVNLREIALCHEMTLDYPIRIGLVGQATEAKGITSFLSLARYFQGRHPRLVEFHLVGRALPGDDLTRFAPLAHPVGTDTITRDEFLARLSRLHYVCLPMQPGYYSLSASGALVDAITWLKPVIATPLPVITDLANRYGDVGFICRDEADMRRAIESMIVNPEEEGYRRQTAALRCAREARMPEHLALSYRVIESEQFGGLLSGVSNGSKISSAEEAVPAAN